MPGDNVDLKPYKTALEALLSHHKPVKMLLNRDGEPLDAENLFKPVNEHTQHEVIFAPTGGGISFKNHPMEKPEHTRS